MFSAIFLTTIGRTFLLAILLQRVDISLLLLEIESYGCGTYRDTTLHMWAQITPQSGQRDMYWNLPVVTHHSWLVPLPFPLHIYEHGQELLLRLYFRRLGCWRRSLLYLSLYNLRLEHWASISLRVSTEADAKGKLAREKSTRCDRQRLGTYQNFGKCAV